MKGFRNSVRGDIGRMNDNPPKPFVMLDIDNEWLTPRQARLLAECILKAAVVAEEKYAEHKAKAKP